MYRSTLLLLNREEEVDMRSLIRAFRCGWLSTLRTTVASWLARQFLQPRVPAPAVSRYRNAISLGETMLKMKYVVSFVLGCSLLASPIGRAQQQPSVISIIRLVAAPEKFDGKMVAVEGLLRIGEHPEFFGEQPILYLHDEDAKNLLAANAVWVIPSDQMRRDREKLDRMYVNMTGVFRASHSDPEHLMPGKISQFCFCPAVRNQAHPLVLGKNSRRPK